MVYYNPMRRWCLQNLELQKQQRCITSIQPAYKKYQFLRQDGFEVSQRLGLWFYCSNSLMLFWSPLNVHFSTIHNFVTNSRKQWRRSDMKYMCALLTRNILNPRQCGLTLLYLPPPFTARTGRICLQLDLEVWNAIMRRPPSTELY